MANDERVQTGNSAAQTENTSATAGGSASQVEDTTTAVGDPAAEAAQTMSGGQEQPEGCASAQKGESAPTESELERIKAELERTQVELERTKAELEQANRMYLRALADFDNYRRRTASERDELRSSIVCDFVEKLLPVIDNLERALSSGTESGSSVLNGVRMVYDQLIRVLADNGIDRIDALGKQFDPHVHHAVMQSESDEHEDNVVVEEFQKGYMSGKRVIRPAMVRVNHKTSQFGAE